MNVVQKTRIMKRSRRKFPPKSIRFAGKRWKAVSSDYMSLSAASKLAKRVESGNTCALIARYRLKGTGGVFIKGKPSGADVVAVVFSRRRKGSCPTPKGGKRGSFLGF